jgi:phage tail sheath protein FI
MATITYPGLYVEEVSSGVHTIAGASTSNTAFADVFARGPIDKPVEVTSWDDFEREFGGLRADSEASYAIQQYYLNQGQIAWVIRIGAGNPKTASLLVPSFGSPQWDAILVSAANPGAWGNNVQAAVTYPDPSDTSFNLLVQEVATVNGRTVIRASESFLRLNMTPGDQRYAPDVVNQTSRLVSLSDATTNPPTGSPPVAPLPVGSPPTKPVFTALVGGVDASVVNPTTGDLINGNDVANALLGAPPYDIPTLGWKAGITALDEIAPQIFNILCLPVAAKLGANDLNAVYAGAIQYCAGHRAMCIVDIPESVDNLTQMDAWLQTGALDRLRHENAAVYFPRLTIPDALNQNRPREVAVSGTLAGVWARTDATRHLWKAPAGTEASLTNATLVATLTDLENGGLNPFGVNVLRTFPLYGPVSWGARTLFGEDQRGSEWKYIPVRRTALYIEESLVEGLKWVVFEPNDAPLWAQIRLNVGAFMQDLFRNGAFQGASPQEAYFVKCSKDTTTQQDIDRGIVNILVGFAPLKPAEFVVIKIQQIAGQLQT